MVTKDSKTEANKIIGKAVCEKRREKGFTQAQTAESTGLSRSYIADIEHGRYAPSIKALTKLAKCLELDLNLLISST